MKIPRTDPVKNVAAPLEPDTSWIGLPEASPVDSAMAPLHAPPLADNSMLREFGRDVTPVSWGDFLGASAKEALWQSPVMALKRMADVTRAEEEDSPVMSPREWADSEWHRPGLSFPGGVKTSVARLLAERHDEEEARKEAFSRGPSGVLATVAGFGAGVVGSLLDPLNVASAFVPILGPARYAMLLERLGVAGTAARVLTRPGVARTIQGAAEGGVGAAMIEPLTLTANLMEQSEYGPLDSLLNVAMGTVMGAGLHTGLGALGDWIGRAHPRTLETAFRTAEGQLADGRPVKVEPVFDADPNAPPVRIEEAADGATLKVFGGESFSRNAFVDALFELPITATQRADTLTLWDRAMRNFARALGVTDEEAWGRVMREVRTGEEGAGAKAAVRFAEDGRAVMDLFRGSDVTATMSGLARIGRRYIPEADLKTFEAWLSVKNGAWTAEAENALDLAFQRYIMEGKAPTSKLKRAFGNLKRWFAAVYESVTSQFDDVVLSDDMRDAFDRMLAEPGELKKSRLQQAAEAYADEMISASDEGRAEGVLADMRSAGVRMDSAVTDTWEKETRATLVKMYPGMFRKKGRLTLDEAADMAGFEDLNSFADWLQWGRKSKAENRERYIEEYIRQAREYADTPRVVEDVDASREADEIVSNWSGDEQAFLDDAEYWKNVADQARREEALDAADVDALDDAAHWVSLANDYEAAAETLATCLARSVA